MLRRDNGHSAHLVPRRAGMTSNVTLALVAGLLSGLAFAVCVTWLIIHRRNQHREQKTGLENGIPNAQPLAQDMREIVRPANAAPRTRFRTAEWDHFSSSESICDPTPVHTCSSKRKRNTISLPKRIKQKGANPTKPWSRKHLSIIAEHPASTTPPRKASLPIFDEMQRSASTSSQAPRAVPNHSTIREVPSSPSASPHVDVPPSFAVRSQHQYGTKIVQSRDGKPKLTLCIRSVSLGVLTDDGAVFDEDSCLPLSKRKRPEMHARSVSLGAPATKPPAGPVPPLPVNALTSNSQDRHWKAQDGRISRMSSASSISAGSSVLVTSPILERRDTDQPLQSPTFEEMVANNNNAELKAVAQRQWQERQRSCSRSTANTRLCKPCCSVRGRIVRSSTDSALTHCRSNSASTLSSFASGKNRFSVPQICSAEKVSFSRVSSNNSLLATGSINKITTPTKRINRMTSVTSVSINGSPAERKRGSILREVSGNAATSAGNTPTREPSDSTLVSRSSSNGNPFHWDNASVSSITATKPSAMKGSPNSRKAHRRQPCVRISTLSPQVLGPSASRRRSRSISPATFLQGVIEERESEDLQRPRTEPVVTPTEERQSFLLACGGRAPKANAMEFGNLRVQTLRASLTPSSPTLSTWIPYQQDVPEKSITSVLSPVSPLDERDAFRISNGSFHIPKFPSPVGKARASVSPIQCATAPTAQFVGLSPVDAVSPLDNLSPTDFRNSRPTSTSAALDIHSENQASAENVELASSPPLPVSKTAEYDPASPRVPTVVHHKPGSEEYDPASPPSTVIEQASKDGDDRSIFLPLALDGLDLMGDKIAAVDTPQQMSISPSSSPKTVSRARFDTLIDAEQPIIPDRNPRRAAVKLTSENASSVAASQTVNFPGSNVPVLLPPKHYDTGDFSPLPRWENEISYEDITLDGEEPVQEAPAPRGTLARPPSLPTIIQESSSPPAVPTTMPLRLRERTASPLGPRAPPAKSLLRNVTELRRMNSEAQVQSSRESRNYVRLGREASPLLPWTPSTGSGLQREQSSNSLLTVESAGSESRSGKESNAVDEIDFDALARNIDSVVKGIDEDWMSSLRQQSSPVSHKRSDSDKENQDKDTQHKRSSSVRDDGEKYWTHQIQYMVSSPGKKSPKHGNLASDTNMLSTPVKNDESRKSIAATPKSLYDADGFLRM